MAGQDLAVLLPAYVDDSERRRGQGDEQARVRADRLRDAFAADESGADELVGVGAVRFGAGGAAGGAAGLARDAQDAVGLVVGGVTVQELAGGLVVVLDFAA